MEPKSSIGVRQSVIGDGQSTIDILNSTIRHETWHVVFFINHRK